MKPPALLSRAFTAVVVVVLLLTVGASPVRAQDPPARAIYDAGQWTLHAYGSASFGDEAGEIYQVRVGGARHWEHGLALEISSVVGYFSSDPILKEEQEDGGVAGFDLLFRWYFHRAENWAMYSDVGAGMLWFSDEFPTVAGTSFNFEPQAGVGLTRRLSPNVWFLAGARWHHVSNSDVVGHGDNRGYDAAMPYFGITWVR